MLAIRDHLADVHDLAAHDVSAAMSRMAESVVEFLETDALTEALLDPSLAFMFSLAGLFEDATLSKSARKDQRKADHIRSVTAHVYAGVPHKIARWGHEAHGEGLRAFGIDRSTKTSPEMKMKAHHDAYQAHTVAAHHLGRAGHKQAAELHQRAAAYHRDRRSALTKTHSLPSMEAAPDLRDVPSKMHVAAWRLGKLRKKLRTKSEAKEPRTKRRPDSSVAFPKEEQIQNWIADLDEGGYSDDVKRASKLAADATATSQKPHANSDHHDTAARLHFIAHGVAKAHGHEDLAKKHLQLVQHHKKAAAQAKAVA
jgi:hypothetical protein